MIPAGCQNHGSPEQVPRCIPDISRLKAGRAGRFCGGLSFRSLAMGFKVAVGGATGKGGREMLNVLAGGAFRADGVVALGSRRSMGVEVSFGNKTLKVKAL